MQTKKVIRKQKLTQRASLSKREKEIAEKKITDQVISLKEFQEAECILLYANTGSEVSTKEIFEQALKLEKEVFFPKVLSDEKMEFYRVWKADDFVSGTYNIMEPSTDTLFIQKNSAFMILPLSAFDQKKNRLGYGKGYYDRYLRREKNIITCGIAFECQKWEDELPVDAYDYPLEMIVTEKTIYL